MNPKRLLALLVFASLAAAPAAFADTVDLTLLNPVQAGPEGSVFTYDATVTNPNSVVEYLNADSFTTSGGPLTVDDSDFFNNFPLSLDPGASFTGALFTVTAVPGSGNTTTLGSFVLQGGPNPGDQGNLAAVGFSATVTPEPSSLLLLATGAMGGFAAVRRRLAGRP